MLHFGIGKGNGSGTRYDTGSIYLHLSHGVARHQVTTRYGKIGNVCLSISVFLAVIHDAGFGISRNFHRTRQYTEGGCWIIIDDYSIVARIASVQHTYTSSIYRDRI